MIDSHSHVWSPDTDRFPLAPGLTAADLDPPSFTDAELLATAGAAGVSRVVLIQHSIFHRFDNATLLDAVRRNPRAFRAVGMVDDRGSGPGEKMRALLPQGFTGFRIRPLLRDEDRALWLDSPGMHEMWETAARTRQAMCCLIEPCDLPAVDAMCERHPETPVVIDHLGRVGGDGVTREAEVALLCRLARHRHTAVKVSAFYALGRKRPPYRDLVPTIRRAFEAFGPNRLMWGSDSPYQLREGQGYAESLALVREGLDFLTPSDRSAMLNDTAERVFFFA